MKLSRNWKHLSVMAEANKRIVIILVQGGLVSGDSRPYTDTLFFCFDKFWTFENFLLNPGFLMCHGSIASERHFKKFVNNLILLFILQSKLMVSVSLFPYDPDLQMFGRWSGEHLQDEVFTRSTKDGCWAK